MKKNISQSEVNLESELKKLDLTYKKNELLIFSSPYLAEQAFNFLYSKWDVEDGCNIQRYDPGHYYDSHWDVVRNQGHMEHGADEYSSVRLLGWMFYLNDIKNKGGTCWPQQNFTSKPRAGDLYIWPAGWTHSHYGIPAPTETKYIITGWCSFSSSGMVGDSE